MINWENLSHDEKNALIAEKVFNEEFYRAPMLDWPGRYVKKWIPLTEWQKTQKIGEWEYDGPYYTINLGSAWGILEKLRKLNYMVSVESALDSDGEIFGWKVCAFDYKNSGRSFTVESKDLKDAICLVSLKIFGVEFE